MKTRLYAAAVFAGVAAIAVLVVVVLRVGRFDPSPPSLRANPVRAIPGEILYVDPKGCIVRARASGASREPVRCPDVEIGAVSWLDRDRIGYVSFGPGQPTWTEIALTTGATTVRGQYADRQPPNEVSPRGERIEFDQDGAAYRVAEGERVKVFDFDGPRFQRPWVVTWSPDGEWVLLRYENELWIVSRDGAVRGTLATIRSGSQGASWWIDGLGYLPPIALRDVDTLPATPAPVTPVAPAATPTR